MMMVSAQGHTNDNHHHHHHEHRRRYSLAPSLVASETSSWDEEEDDDDDGEGKGNPNSSSFLCDFDLFENLPSSICDDFVVCQHLTTAPQYFSDSSAAAAAAASWSENRNMSNNNSGNFLTDFTNQLQLFLSCRHPLEYLGLVSDENDDDYQQQQVEGGEEGNCRGQQQQQEPPPQQHTNRSSGYHSLSQSCEYCGSPDISLCRPAEGVVPFSTFSSTCHDTSSTSTVSFNCLVVPSPLPSSTNINITTNPVTDAHDCSQSETSNRVPVLSVDSSSDTTLVNFTQEMDPNSTTITAAANETYRRCQRPTSFFARRRPPFRPKSSTEWDKYDFKIIEP